MKKQMAWILTALLISNLASVPVLAQTPEEGTSSPSVSSQNEESSTETDGTPAESSKETSGESASATSSEMSSEANTGTTSQAIESFTDFDAAGFTPYQTLTVERGTPLSELNLPQQVQAVINGKTITVPVKWNCTDDSFGGSVYNPEPENDAAVFTFTAQLPDGYTADSLPYIEVRFDAEENENARSAELTDLSLPSTQNNGTLQYTVSGSNAFNIQGVKSGSAIQTTYSNNGYEMYLCVDNKYYKDSSNSVKLTAVNGKVGTFKNIQYQPEVSFTEDGAFVKVTYRFHNLNTTAQTINICGGGDIKIGDDDRAPITRTGTGFTMVDTNEGGKNQFSFYGKSTYGATPVDTYWFGDYSIRYSNYFKSTTENSLTGTDSGMAYSWQDRILQPGETKEFTVLFGVGEAGDPPQLDVNNDISLEYDADKVDVTAKVTEKTDRTYRLYYALDGGARQTLNISGHGTDAIPGSGSAQELTGQIAAADWAENSVHTVEIWAQNDKNAMSEVKTVRIVKLAGGTTGEVEERTVTFDRNGAVGIAPTAVKAEDLSTITLPGASVMMWTGASLAGWTDGTTLYQPGGIYTVPYGSDVTLKAVWNVTYRTYYYLEDETAGRYTLTDNVSATAEAGTEVTAQVKDYEHYVKDDTVVGALSTMTLPTSATNATGILRVYYNRELMTVSFDAGTNGGKLDNSADATRQVRYGTKLGELPVVKDRPGYTFLGWANNSNEETAEVTKYTVIQNNQTFYAIWTKNIIWINSIDNLTAVYGTAITEQQITVRNGSGRYRFTAENLPDGLSLSEGGKFSGTPTGVTTGAVTVTVNAEDELTGKTDRVTFEVTVTPRTLTVTGAAQTSKTYDAGSTIETGNLTLENLLPGDTVTATASASFNNPNAGENKTIALNSIVINGEDAENYTIAGTASISGKILPRAIAVTAKTQSKKTGEQNPTGVLTEVGADSALQGSDMLEDLGSTVFDYTAVEEKVGSYIVGLAMEDTNSNYTITCTDGSLVVTQDVPTDGTNYSVSGTLGEDSWYTGEAVLKPTGGFDKIVVDSDSADQIAVKDDTKEITFHMEKTATGEFTAEKTITLKSDTIAPEFGEVTVKAKNSGTLAEIGRTLSFGHFFKEAVEVNIPVTDETSGVKTVEYCLPDGTYQQAAVKDGKVSFDLPLGTNGTIQIRATDNAGNTNTASNLEKDGSFVWVVENTAPQISPITTDSTAVNGWYHEKIDLHATVTDKTSGLNVVEWTNETDGETQKLFSNPTELVTSYELTEKSIDCDGSTSIKLTAEDNAKNQAEVKQTFKIDQELPQISEITGNPDRWQNEQANISFTLHDGFSGIDEATVTVTKDGVPMTVSAKGQVWSFTTDGNGTYVVNAKDKASNAMETQEIVVTKIQTEEPSKPDMGAIDSGVVNGNDPSSTAGLPSTADGWYTTDNVTMTLKNPETTEEQAPQHYCYRIWEDGTKPEDAQTVSFDGTNPPTLTKDGTWNVEIWLEDEAGNHSESVTKTLKIDATAPEASAEEDHFVTKNSTKQTAEVVLSDALSGINPDSIMVMYKGGEVASKTEVKDGKTVCTFDVAKGGVYTVAGLDEAGNKVEFSVTVTALQAQIETGIGAWGTCDLDELLATVDLSEYKDGETVTVSLKIAPADTEKLSKEEQELFRKQVRSDAKLFYLDISLVKAVEQLDGTVSEEELTTTNKAVQLTVTIPENLRGKYNYQILRMHGDTCEVVASERSKDGTSIVFTTDKFSAYALSYTDTKEVPVTEPAVTEPTVAPTETTKPAVTPNTGDETPLAVPGVAAAIAALAAVGLLRRKNRKDS